MKSALILSGVDGFDPLKFSSVRSAFSGLPGVALGQSWLKKTEEAFRPAVVRAAFQDGAVWVFSELEDDDIVSWPVSFNEAEFMRGDAFEMFFAPEGQAAYFEFHVTPSNSVLQLRFPGRGVAREGRPSGEDPLAPFKVGDRLFESWTWVEKGGWFVLSRIPLSSIVEKENALPGDGEGIVMRFSFCRYDWTTGCSRPVLSSSSPHTACDFHRIEEWGRLEIPPTQAVFPVQQ